MNNLALGITIALRDAFSLRARNVEHAFRSLDATSYRAARGIRQALGGIELGFEQVARTMAAAAALMGAVAFPIAQAAKFEDQMAKIAGIADYAETHIESLRRTLLRQSTILPYTPMEQATAVYDAVQAGFLKTAQAQHVAQVAGDMAVGSHADFKSSLEGLISVMNAYNMKASEATHVSNMMFETVRLGRIEMNQLAHSIGMVSAFAATSKIAPEELLGVVATMTLGGLSPEQTMQYSRQLFGSIIKPSKQALTTAKQHGIELGLPAMQKAGGFRKKIEEMWMKTNADRDPRAFFQMLTGRQAFAGAATLMQKRVQWAEIERSITDYNVPGAEDMWGRPTTSLQRAKEFVMDRLLTQAKLLKASLLSLFTTIGQAGEQFLVPFVKSMNTLVGAIQKFVMEYPLLTKVIFGWTAAMGIGLAVFALMRLRTILAGRAFHWFAGRIAMVRFGIFGLRVTARHLAGAFFLLGAASILAYKAFKENWMGFGTWLKGIGMIASAVFTGLSNMEGQWAIIPEYMAQALEKAGLFDEYEYWVRVIGRVKFAFEAMVVGFKAWWRGLGVGLLKVGAAIAAFVRPFSGPLAAKIENFFKSLKLDATSLASWQQIGYNVGRVMGLLAAIYAVVKLWRGALLLVNVAVWLLIKPFRILWGIIRGIGHALMFMFVMGRRALLGLVAGSMAPFWGWVVAIGATILAVWVLWKLLIRFGRWMSKMPFFGKYFKDDLHTLEVKLPNFMREVGSDIAEFLKVGAGYLMDAGKFLGTKAKEFADSTGLFGNFFAMMKLPEWQIGPTMAGVKKGDPKQKQMAKAQWEAAQANLARWLPSYQAGGGAGDWVSGGKLDKNFWAIVGETAMMAWFLKNMGGAPTANNRELQKFITAGLLNQDIMWGIPLTPNTLDQQPGTSGDVDQAGINETADSLENLATAGAEAANALGGMKKSVLDFKKDGPMAAWDPYALAAMASEGRYLALLGANEAGKSGSLGVQTFGDSMTEVLTKAHEVIDQAAAAVAASSKAGDVFIDGIKMGKHVRHQQQREDRGDAERTYVRPGVQRRD